MCLAQGHNAVTLVRLEPAAFRSRVKHSTPEPLRSLSGRMCICQERQLCVKTSNCVKKALSVCHERELFLDVRMAIVSRDS